MFPINVYQDFNLCLNFPWIQLVLFKLRSQFLLFVFIFYCFSITVDIKPYISTSSWKISSSNLILSGWKLKHMETEFNVWNSCAVISSQGSLIIKWWNHSVSFSRPHSPRLLVSSWDLFPNPYSEASPHVHFFLIRGHHNITSYANQVERVFNTTEISFLTALWFYLSVWCSLEGLLQIN